MTYEPLPVNDIPKIPPFEAGCTLWWDSDSESNFLKAAPSLLFNRESITYQFNSHGFRAPEFDATGQIKIISIGCSYVHGCGLPRSSIFHELVAHELGARLGQTVVNWNLGCSGASNAYITRLLILALPLLKPDLVLVNFTHPMRRDHFAAHGKWLRFFPNFQTEDLSLRGLGKNFEDLASPNDDKVNLFLNYMSVRNLLANTPWFCSSIISTLPQTLGPFMDAESYVGSLDFLDRARDGLHPGFISHQILARNYLMKIFGSEWFLKRQEACNTRCQGNEMTMPDAVTFGSALKNQSPDLTLQWKSRTTSRAKNLLRHVLFGFLRRRHKLRSKVEDSNIYPHF